MRALLASLVLFTCTVMVQAKGPSFTDPETAAKSDPDFAFQGEYASEKGKYGVQIIALGGGKFQAVSFPGGLPGAGWEGKMKYRAEGTREGDVLTVKGKFGTVTVKGSEMVAVDPDGAELGTLKKVMRKSETLGMKPPEGAVVLNKAEDWKNGKLSPEGYLMQGITSKAKFQSHKLHLEFRLPYQPENRGQGRGNSGMYVQGRYEVQMLDSFGLEGKHNECGGIYSIKDPDVNMCYPPLSWQTYDVEFTAAKYDEAGKMTAKPKMTVKHNGVVVHKEVELPKSTTAAPVRPGADSGPIYLQNHGNPVRYRNIWVVETK